MKRLSAASVLLLARRRRPPRRVDCRCSGRACPFPDGTTSSAARASTTRATTSSPPWCSARCSSWPAFGVAAAQRWGRVLGDHRRGVRRASGAALVVVAAANPSADASALSGVQRLGRPGGLRGGCRCGAGPDRGDHGSARPHRRRRHVGSAVERLTEGGSRPGGARLWSGDRELSPATVNLSPSHPSCRGTPMKPAPRRWQVSDSAPLPGHPPLLGRILASRGHDGATSATFLDTAPPSTIRWAWPACATR